MSETPIQDAVRSYALEQVGAAYVMGATAQKCTPSMRRALANGRSSEYADKITGNCPVLSGRQSSCDGCKYEGRRAFDCAQLSKYAAKAGGIDLPSGSNSQWTKVDWAVRGEIAGMPTDVVCFVYHVKDGRMSHVGVYLGDGTVADARGHAYGVLHRDVASYPWTHYAVPKEIAQEVGLMDGETHETYWDTSRPTLRKGRRGVEVSYLQQLLNDAGCSPEIEEDGLFGSATQAAVLDYQVAHDLPVDGVVGPMTWAALEGHGDTQAGPVEEADAEGEDETSDEPSAWDALVSEIRQACGELRTRLDNLAALIEEADGMHKADG